MVEFSAIHPGWNNTKRRVNKGSDSLSLLYGAQSEKNQRLKRRKFSHVYYNNAFVLVLGPPQLAIFKVLRMYYLQCLCCAVSY